MKVLITGAGGGLGTSLNSVLLSNPNFQTLPTDVITQISQPHIRKLNVCDSDEMFQFVSSSKPDILVHLAAKTDVDGCEKDPQSAYKLNSQGTENVARICEKFSIPMVYISTMEVFDGEKKTPYIETDIPNPLNVYAKSKYEGEKFVQSILTQYYIVRIAWLVSGGKNDKKFVGKIIRLMETEKEIKVVSDKIGSPTFAEDLSINLSKLIETGKYGTYHMCNKGFCSRYEMALKIKEFLGKNSIKITPVSSDYFNLPAHRGPSEAAINFNLQKLGIDLMPSWEKSLEKYLKGISNES